ncbi:MAG: hypothetical protein IJZ06_06790 [Bacteroidales bacterium]|nr:hypothetical protein [Bacteroidales bacterium]
MKKIIVVIISLLLSLNVFSQEERFRPVQINFGFPLSTINVKEAKSYTNTFSINLLVGISKNERSLALSCLSNIVANDATGLQIAGISNHIGNKGYGIAVAGVANTAGFYNGIQIGGISNFTKDSNIGLQIAGILNHIGDKGYGIAVAGVANTAGFYNGIQIGGISNFTKDSNIGLQIGGIVNYSGSAKGLMLAGISNISGDFTGFQFAGVMNVAKIVKGVQFASIINIADDSDFPIAFINIIKNGKMGVSLSYDMLNNTVLSFRSGGKYTYGILGVGYNFMVNDGSKIVAEAGYGIHIPVNHLFEINNEFKAVSVGFSNDKTCYNFSYLIAPSVTFWSHYNVFGGVSFNYLNSNYVESNDLFPKKYFWNKDTNDNTQRMYVGYQIGVQYVF